MLTHIFFRVAQRLAQLLWGEGIERGQTRSLHLGHGSTIWRDTAEKPHSWPPTGQPTHMAQHFAETQAYVPKALCLEWVRGVFVQKKKKKKYLFCTTPPWPLYNSINIAGQLPAPSRARSLHRTSTPRKTESDFRQTRRTSWRKKEERSKLYQINSRDPQLYCNPTFA